MYLFVESGWQKSLRQYRNYSCPYRIISPSTMDSWPKLSKGLNVIIPNKNDILLILWPINSSRWMKCMFCLNWKPWTKTEPNHDLRIRSVMSIGLLVRTYISISWNCVSRFGCWILKKLIRSQCAGLVRFYLYFLWIHFLKIFSRNILMIQIFKVSHNTLTNKKKKKGRSKTRKNR